MPVETDPSILKIPMLRKPQLPDPDAKTDTDVVIYDGQCRFCQAQVKRLAQLDRSGNHLSFISLHDPRVAERYPDLTHEQLMEQMYVVTLGGTRYGGADAVRYLSRRLPLLWIVAPLMHIPGSARLWRWMYRQVAKRRYRLAGKDCDGDACSVHLD